MAKKQNVMSMSMEPDLQAIIRLHAKKRRVSNSKIIRDLVEKYLHNEDEVVPVILKVPVSLRGDPEALEKWFSQRLDIIIKTLGAKVNDQ